VLERKEEEEEEIVAPRVLVASRWDEQQKLRRPCASSAVEFTYAFIYMRTRKMHFYIDSKVKVWRVAVAVHTVAVLAIPEWLCGVFELPGTFELVLSIGCLLCTGPWQPWLDGRIGRHMPFFFGGDRLVLPVQI
jgi:hypothetical protein